MGSADDAPKMTHRLLLLRHAKSSWDDASLPDHDRPLAKRGRRAAERIGAHLRSLALLPDLVLCSSARRTRETLERLALEGVESRVDDRLYGASDGEILSRIRDVSADVETLLVVGHNPGMQDLAIELSRSDPAEPADRLREGFPTGAIAVFDVDGPWTELTPGRARLASVLVPRKLA
jgi:phosphohistidine phosphatase